MSMEALGLQLLMTVEGVEHVAYEPTKGGVGGVFYVGDTRGLLPEDVKTEAKLCLERLKPAGYRVSLLPYRDKPDRLNPISGRENTRNDRIRRAQYYTNREIEAILDRLFPSGRFRVVDVGPGTICVIVDYRSPGLGAPVKAFMEEMYPELVVKVEVGNPSNPIPEFRGPISEQGLVAPARWQKPSTPLVERFARESDEWFDVAVTDVLTGKRDARQISPYVGDPSHQAVWIPSYAPLQLAQALALYDRVFLGILPDSPILKTEGDFKVLQDLAVGGRVVPVLMHPLARYSERVLAPFLSDGVPAILPRELDALLLAGAVHRKDLWLQMRQSPSLGQALFRGVGQARLLREVDPNMDQVLQVMHAELQSQVDSAIALEENVWQKGWQGMLWGLPGSLLLHLNQSTDPMPALPAIMTGILDVAIGDSFGAVVSSPFTAQANLVASVGYRGLIWSQPRHTPRVNDMPSLPEILHGLRIDIPTNWSLQDYANVFTPERTVALRHAVQGLFKDLRRDTDLTTNVAAVKVAVEQLNYEIRGATTKGSAPARVAGAVNQLLQPVGLLVSLATTIHNPYEQWLVNDVINAGLLKIAASVSGPVEDIIQKVVACFGFDLGRPAQLVLLHETQKALAEGSPPSGSEDVRK